MMTDDQYVKNIEGRRQVSMSSVHVGWTSKRFNYYFLCQDSLPKLVGSLNSARRSGNNGVPSEVRYNLNPERRF